VNRYDLDGNAINFFAALMLRVLIAKIVARMRAIARWLALRARIKAFMDRIRRLARGGARASGTIRNVAKASVGARLARVQRQVWNQCRPGFQAMTPCSAPGVPSEDDECYGCQRKVSTETVKKCWALLVPYFGSPGPGELGLSMKPDPVTIVIGITCADITVTWLLQ